MTVQTITPVAAAETFGAVIARDPVFSKGTLLTLRNQINQAVTVRVYGSNYNDPTMAQAVLETTIAMGAGNVTPTTAGYHTQVPYHYYRVSVEPAGGPAGNFTATWLDDEEL